jgi:outer membrane protein TolC
MKLRGSIVRRGRALLVLALATVIAAACATSKGPPAHERPLGATDVALTGPSIAVPVDGWWLALDDPQLDRLVATALARNPGLAGALARVRVAREQVAIVDSTNAPQVNFDATEFRTRVSANYIFPPPYGGGTYWDGRIGFNLGWHLDFWGRQAALIEQVSRGADAAALDAAASELMLSSAVAQAYVEYAKALRLEQVALRAQAQRRALADLTAQRAAAGLDSQVEVRITEANLEQSAVDIEQARMASELSRHVLAALTGASAAMPPLLEAPTLDFERALPVPGRPRGAGADRSGSRGCRRRARELLSERGHRRFCRSHGDRARQDPRRRLAELERRPRHPPADIQRRPLAGGIPALRRRTRRSNHVL